VSCGNNNQNIESKCVSTDECWIERPKYYKGMLLTDADLTSEQKYVIEKNKLHNRYLHGWGVVCGLKVKCFPCCTGHGASGKVLVEPGYAIDCCGNDIIICNEDEYDVVKRINELKKKKQAEIDPCSGETSKEEATCNCKTGGEKYYLVLKYKEVSSKPATALNTQDGCSIQSCVPSRIEECYELDLVEYCTLDRTMEERFISKVLKCIELFVTTWQKVFGDKATDVFKLNEDQLKTFIKEYHKVLPSHVNCDILDELDAIDSSGDEGEKKYLFNDKVESFQGALVAGSANELLRRIFIANGITLSASATVSSASTTDWQVIDGTNTYSIELSENRALYNVYLTTAAGQTGIIQLYIIIFGLLLECICQALLRPCPECGEDDIVILSSINVKGKKIDSICNFERKTVMTFPTLFYYLPLDVGFERITKLICCDLVDFLASVFQGVEFPAYRLFATAAKNNFAAPKMMSTNLVKAFKVVPQSMFKILDPMNVSLQGSINKDITRAKTDLKKNNIEVVGTERFKPSLADLSLERIISSVPLARPGSKVISLVDDKNVVVGFRVVEEGVEKTVTPGEKTPGVADVTGLIKEIDDLKASVAVMKTHMKKDSNVVIETRVPVEKTYRSLTTELTTSLLKEIPSEELKDVGDVRASEMKKANIKSVFDILEAVPAAVSDAVKEPMSNAVKYVDNAEEYTVEVAKLIAEEMKAKEIKKKADLDKIDTEKIAKELKISEKVVKRSIENIK
jgi:hypothetical protein